MVNKAGIGQNAMMCVHNKVSRIDFAFAASNLCWTDINIPISEPSSINTTKGTISHIFKFAPSLNPVCTNIASTPNRPSTTCAYRQNEKSKKLNHFHRLRKDTNKPMAPKTANKA